MSAPLMDRAKARRRTVGNCQQHGKGRSRASMHAGPGESVRRCYLWSRGEPCSQRLKCFRINSRLVIMVTSRDCACAVLCPCDELFEQLPLTFHASLALEHLSAHLAELFETLGLEPLASVAQGRGDVGELPLYFGGRTLGDLLLCLGENGCDGIRAEIGQPRVQRKPHRGSPHRLYYRLTR